MYYSVLYILALTSYNYYLLLTHTWTIRLKWTSSVGWANYVQHLFKNLDQRKVELASVRSKNIYRKQIDFGPKGPFKKKSHTQ